MANSIFGITPKQGTDAEFRAWGSTLSAQLSAFLTRFTTTGDINWTTVTNPASSSTYQGFEVYRFNDVAQTTHPIFLKFEYGSNDYGYDYPGIRLTIAKNCAADGVLSNIIFPTTLIYFPGTLSSTSYNCYISGHGSGFAFALCPAVLGSACILLVERAIDSNGVVNGEGLYVGLKNNCSAASNNNHYFISYSAGTLNSVSSKGIYPIPLDLSSDISLANGTITPYFPAACLNSSGLYWIPRIALGGAKADCALGSVVNNLLDGINYIGLGDAASGADQRTSANSSLMMRW